MARVNLITMRNVGERLKLLRKELGLSQMELSYKSGVSQPSIARIEAGRQQNLKSGTIEKLASALEIPLSHLLEEPMIISEDVLGYEATKMIPVFNLQKFISSGCRIRTGEKPDRFEPSLSRDSSALFLTSCSSLGSDMEDRDLLLIEPSSKINDGDTVLVLSKNKHCIGRIYRHPSTWIIQPLKSDAAPAFCSPKLRKKRYTKLFKVSEIRKKI